MSIRLIQENDLPLCLAVIRESFATVAAAFGLTEQNCPTHTSFMKLEQLQKHFEWGWKMFDHLPFTAGFLEWHKSI